MRRKVIIFLFLISTSLHIATASGADKPVEAKMNHQAPVLIDAAMGEGIKDGALQNQAVVFSVMLGRVICHSSFDPVPQRTFIYHNWYFRDRLSTKIRLVLMPPRWSTYSYIQLREADKGPWRVEITTEDGRILKVLRFSITD